MFATSTAISSITSLVTDLGLVFASVVGVILALWASLVGLGWGISKVRRYIAGRKF